MLLITFINLFIIKYSYRILFILLDVIKDYITQ